MLAAAIVALDGAWGTGVAETAQARFQRAGELARAATITAIAIYNSLAGRIAYRLESALSASARGATGEALWALLRARELGRSDRAVNEIERLPGSADTPGSL
jgi:hypothetical protein